MSGSRQSQPSKPAVGNDANPGTPASPSQTTPARSYFRPDIEGLRGLAILLVVFYHVGVRRLGGGYVGVDLFFVISGYVITGLLLRERASHGNTRMLTFYARRIRRILPAALLVIVVSLAITGVLLNHQSTVDAASDSRWATLFAGNFRFNSVFPNIFVIHRQSMLQNFWSLAVEEQFYLVYPLVFAVLIGTAAMHVGRRRLAIGLSAILVGSFIYCAVSTAVGTYGAYYSPLARAWELAVGCLLAVATSYPIRLHPAVAASVTWLGMAAVVASALLFSDLTRYPGVLAAIPVVGGALIIGGGTGSSWGTGAVLSQPPVRLVGRWSYSWYLWHWPILVIAAECLHTTTGNSRLTTNLALALGSFCLAGLTYRFVEQPMRRSAVLDRHPQATVIVGIGIALVVFALTFAF